MISFRPLALRDLPAVHRWMNAPHAERWWGRRGMTLEAVVEEYSSYIDGRVPIHAYVVRSADRDIGLMEWVRFGDFPELMEVYGVEDPEAVNCDALIGEPSFAHRGLGPPMITLFLREIAFADARRTACFIDPEAENAIAIRAYEKAGFRFVRDTHDEDGAAIHLMGLTRAQLFKGQNR